jgi:anaerobic selenocysteine-containing dehydrogenase
VAAFEKVEFRVVVDAFMTDTAERADLVLPAALMLEQEDIVGSFMHDYIHYVAKVFDPPGEARSDFTILAELGTRLDPPVLLPAPKECLAMSLASPYFDVSLDELRRKGFVRAKRPPVPYEGMRFDHPDGKFRCVGEIHGEPAAPADFPLRLLTQVRRDAIHSQILQEDQSMPPVVTVSPLCPALTKLDRSRDIYLASPRGRLRVQLELQAGLHQNVVIYRRGDWMKQGGGANQLIAAAMTDIGMGAAYYDEHVRLEN